MIDQMCASIEYMDKKLPSALADGNRVRPEKKERNVIIYIV